MWTKVLHKISSSQHYLKYYTHAKQHSESASTDGGMSEVTRHFINTVSRIRQGTQPSKLPLLREHTYTAHARKANDRIWPLCLQKQSAYLAKHKAEVLEKFLS